ncbi:hypothetical protein M3Y94_00926400 [Aphelenchoides besseyi]|nr:hypothetical protein M3Y94_00926400 [Aphelenchoides besseyi]
MAETRKQQADDFQNAINLRLLRNREHNGQSMELISPEDDTPVSYSILTEYYDVNPKFERVLPISSFSLITTGPNNTVRYGDLIQTLDQFVEVEENFDFLLQLADGSTEIVWEEFVKHVNQRLDELESEIKDEDPEKVSDWREHAMDFVKLFLAPNNAYSTSCSLYMNSCHGWNLETRPTISIADILESQVLDYLNDSKLSPWIDFETFNVFRECYDHVASAAPREVIDSAECLAVDYSLSGEIMNFTPAFLSALWKHLENIGWLQNGVLNFQNFLRLRRMLYFSNHVAGRRFLFDVLDLDQDGRIGLYEFEHFYRSLREVYTTRFPAREFPTESQAFISWFDQLKGDIAPHVDFRPLTRTEKEAQRVSFLDVKHHPYGAEFLACFTSIDGFERVEFRFDDPGTSDQDTEIDPEESTTITRQALEDLLSNKDEDDLANRSDFMHIESD